MQKFLKSLTGELPEVEAIPVSATGSASVPMPGIALTVLAVGVAMAARAGSRDTRVARKQEDDR